MLFLAVELFECGRYIEFDWKFIKFVDDVKVAATLEFDLLQVHLFNPVQLVVVGAEPRVVVVLLAAGGVAAMYAVLNKLGTILDCCAIDHWLSFDEAKLELDEALAIVQRR